jgi:hypothetical protein
VFLNPPIWEKILDCTKHTADVDRIIKTILDEDEFFDEFIHITNVSKTRIDEWNIKSLRAFDRWSKIFKSVQSTYIFH